MMAFVTLITKSETLESQQIELMLFQNYVSIVQKENWVKGIIRKRLVNKVKSPMQLENVVLVFPSQNKTEKVQKPVARLGGMQSLVNKTPLLNVHST